MDFKQLFYSPQWDISGKRIRHLLYFLSKETLLCEWDLTIWSMESILTRCHVMCRSDGSRFEEHMHQRLWIVDQLVVLLESIAAEEAIGGARVCKWWALEWQWQRGHMVHRWWRGGHERQICRWWRWVLLYHGVRVSPHYHIKHLVFEAT